MADLTTKLIDVVGDRTAKALEAHARSMICSDTTHAATWFAGSCQTFLNSMKAMR
jgi:hypothetical protein